jgi:hypothetical protein
MTVATGNEVQTVTITGTPAGGDFTLTFSGQTTTAIAYNATANAVELALEALSNLAPADVAVTGSAGGPYTVTFAGAYEDTDVPVMTKNAAGLTGGTSPNVTVATLTAGNPAVTENAYVDISVASGLVGNLEILPGQVPPAGKHLVDKSDYAA